MVSALLVSLVSVLVYRKMSLDSVNLNNNVIKEELDELFYTNNVNKYLYRYYVFFYTDEYRYREVYITRSSTALQNPRQEVTEEFYVRLLNYHKNGNCYSAKTSDIDPISVVYKNLEGINEVSDNIFYISCPIYVGDTLVGYIGGLSKNTDDILVSEYLTLKNAADNVGKTLTGGYDSWIMMK